jgi:hypothetical protein
VTPDGFEPVVSVTIPDGWYGGAYASGFTVGQGIDDAQQRYADVGLYLDVIDLPYEEAVVGVGQLSGLVEDAAPTSTEIDGHPATTFHVHAEGDHVVLDAIAPGLDIIAEAGPLTLIDVDGTTILVRTEIFDEAAEPTLEEVVGSLTFDDEQ